MFVSMENIQVDTDESYGGNASQLSGQIDKYNIFDCDR